MAAPSGHPASRNFSKMGSLPGMLRLARRRHVALQSVDCPAGGHVPCEVEFASDTRRGPALLRQAPLPLQHCRKALRVNAQAEVCSPKAEILRLRDLERGVGRNLHASKASCSSSFIDDIVIDIRQHATCVASQRSGQSPKSEALSAGYFVGPQCTLHARTVLVGIRAQCT